MSGINWKRLFVVGFIITAIMMIVSFVTNSVMLQLGTIGMVIAFLILIPVLGYVAIWAVNKFKK